MSGPEEVGEAPPALDRDSAPWRRADTRRHIAVFATTGALCFVAALIPLPPRRAGELIGAGALFVALTLLALVVPWARQPRWLWPLIPIAYMGVIALMRNAQGGLYSGLHFLYLLPIVWLALYGTRSHVLAGLGALVLALVVPVVAVGPPDYPTSQWRGVVVTVAVCGLVSFTILAMVARERAYAARLAQRSRTARRSAAEAVEARARLEGMLAAATSTGVIGTDTGGIVNFFSGGAEHALGYPAAEVVGRCSIFDFADPAELLARSDEVQALIAAARPGLPYVASAQESIWTFLRKDGSRRRAALVLTSIYQEGQRVGYVLVANDVTEREQLAAGQARLAAADAEVAEVLAAQNLRLRELTQMKDDVVATVSHELRTPLTSIRGFLELLLHDGRDRFDADTLHMLRTIDRNSRQLLRVAEDLSADPSGRRGLQLDFVETDLGALAADAVDSVATEAAGRRIHLARVADIPVRVRGDSARLHQLLANLLTNALKYSSPGGRVEVRVYATEHLAHLDVLDDGPGISPEDRSRLFERFYRLDHPAIRGVPGTGLGLSIVKSVVDAHEGVVEIVDTPGWSTTFRVLLPLAGGAGAVAEPVAERSPA